MDPLGGIPPKHSEQPVPTPSTPSQKSKPVVLSTPHPSKGPETDVVEAARVKTGLEVLTETRCECLWGKKVGLLCNPSSVLPDLRHAMVALHSNAHVDLRAVFGPEHGFRGTSRPGTGEPFVRDRRTGVPVYDTYAKSSGELAQMFEVAGTDILIIDLQDVGVRFCSYAWTLYDAMEAAAAMDPQLPVMVLDRPNPLGGEVVAGPLMDPQHASILGRKPLPLRHGMTVGELAELYNRIFVEDGGRPAPLRVIAMQGWRRDMAERGATGLPWVAPAPGLPTPDAAAAHAGMALLEGTNCSVGRGTALPFQLVGAPWADHRLAEQMRGAAVAGILQGVLFREASFTPSEQPYAGQLCHGMQVHLTDLRSFDPLRTAVGLIVQLTRLYPDHFQWRHAKGVFRIDELTGSDRLREAIFNGERVDDIISGWQAEADSFLPTRQACLLYS